MSEAIKLSFSSYAAPAKGVLIVFCDENLAFAASARKILGRAADAVKRVAPGEGFKGRKAATLEIVAPANLDAERLVVIGVGKAEDLKEQDFLRLGGIAVGKVPSGLTQATVIADIPGVTATAEQASDLGLGALLRAYRFDRYKTRKKDGEDKPARTNLVIAVKDPVAARKAWARRDAVGNGMALTRDLVNEPPNVLHPEEFARRVLGLKKLGVTVSVLDEKAMKKLGMGALLAVGQGSIRQSRLVVMRWNGAKANARPVAFIGKGVCFDTGGISIKPASGMEDMKGDMAGAACVVGLMHALAARKAKVNAIGAIGVVENMPDGNAYRPGDILTSMSGQTIEVINTDAEGRLVLADVLWYVGTKFKPQFMVNLATLTGAILVALGTEYTGLFSNDDALSKKLRAAGEVTGERLWRMPLGPEYDKLIDSKFADMKNTGGRHAGSITAAQFLQRFVPEKTPWAHLDIAGTGMNSPQTDINKSWASGFGVRLLERLVRDHFEG